MSRGFLSSAWSLPLRLTSFVIWFLGQFVITSLQVVGLILTPGKQPTPGIVKMNIEGLSETETTLLLLLITITPDTLVVAVNREEGNMFVHGMFVQNDAERFRAALEGTRDRLIRGVRARPAESADRGAS